MSAASSPRGVAPLCCVSMHQILYEEAIFEMKKGKYDTSYGLLEKAVSLTGENSRRGGEFKLWAAQALQGVGRNKQAVEILKGMKNHSDRDVQKVRFYVRYLDSFYVRCVHYYMDTTVFISK